MTNARRLLFLATLAFIALAGVAGPPATPLPENTASTPKSAVSFASRNLQRLIVDREAMDDLRSLGEECGAAAAIALVVEDYLRALATEEMRLQAGNGPLVGPDRKRITEELRQRTRDLWESAGALCRGREADVEASRRAWARRAWLPAAGDGSKTPSSVGIDLTEFVRRDFETRVAYRGLGKESPPPELLELRRLLEEYASELDPLIAAYTDDVLKPHSTRGSAEKLNNHWYALDRVARKHAQRIADWIGRRSGAKAALLWRERFLRASDSEYFGTLTPDERRVENALAVNLPEGEELPLEVRRLLEVRWSVSDELRKLMWREWRAFSRHEEPSDELRESVDEFERRLNVAAASAWRHLCRCSVDGDAPPMRPMWAFWPPAVDAEERR